MITVPGIIFCMPVFILIIGSIADSYEWTERLSALLTGGDGYITWKWIPDFPTIEQYRRLLFYTPEFLVLFWNSIKMVGLILLGQLLIAVPSAWCFAMYSFRGRNILFSIYVMLMLLPFQVTMLSKYLVLRDAGLLDTQWSVILPTIFSTFPVFLIYRSFCGLPKELMEAARIDGAGEWRIFRLVGLPLAQGGVMAAMVLGFLEYWNMMEEPLAFIKDKALWPLSLYLPEISPAQAGFFCCASAVVLTVSLFVFALFKDSLTQGIITSGLNT
jgi:multiple sugar transport system permease protein